MTATTPRPDITGRHHTSSLGDDAFAGEPDDPRVQLDRDVGVFEPVPPYPPLPARETEFSTLPDGDMSLNMGPQHPSTPGVLRVVLKLDGEKVVDLDPVL